MDCRTSPSTRSNSREKHDEKPNYFINLGYQLSNGQDSDLEFNPANLNLYKDQTTPMHPITPVGPWMGRMMSRFRLATPDDGIGRRLVFEPGFEPDFENPQ